MAEREEVPTRSWLGRVRLIILVLCVAFCGTATCGWAYDYYVTSTADSGGGEGVFGTFRNAMFYQSTDNDPWWINFEIPTTDPGYDPATGTWTIHLTGQPLYPVDSPSPTEIRGSSQPDYDGINPSGPRIIIDGSGMNSDTDVLVITSDGNDVEGICILNGQRDGIVLHDTAWTDCSSNWIHGCFLGVCPVAGGPDIWSSILFSTAIVIAEGAHDNTIEGNLVTASGGNGIMVSGENTDRNMLTRNKFRPNAALAIALIPGGENDGAMNPEYANDGMDHPVITQAILYQGGVYEWSLTVTGYIGVSPCGDAFFGDTVEFFLASPDGEGELYLGECDVGMATGKENAFISTLDVSTVGLTLSDSIIATAIHGDGNTSEFSSPVQVTDAHTVLVMATTDVLDGNAASISALTSNPGLDGLVSLREAITACNNTPGADTIRFNVPECDPGYSASAGTWTIELTSPLPGLDDNDGVFVDGSSQTANQGDRNAFGPEIVISGASLPASPPGAGPILEIQSSYNHVRQLVLGGNPSVAANVGGIVFWGSESHDNWIEGCYIGVDPTGRAAMPNGGAGIFFDDMGHNIIGTDGDGTEDALEGNVIAANETGGIFSMSVLRNPEYNVIAGNRIGVGTDGTPLPNGVAGIFLGTGDGNRIGSNNDGVSDALEANVIERNDGPGIAVGTKLNTLSRNAFYGNDQLGIDLGTTVGVDVNDGLLNPGSANNGMDYPVFTAASLEGNTLHVEGYIGTNPSGTTTFASSRVEVYLSSYDGSTDPNPGTADAPPYHGEGKVYLGALTANGSSLFAGDLNVTGKGLTEADFLTATATNTAGNTSEFSGNFSLLPPWPPGAAVVDTTSDVADGNTSSISALALNRGADGFVSLREAITACNNTAGANTIVFNVPLSDPGHAGGVWTIQPTSALPALTDDDGVFIDGSSQATFIGGDPNPDGPEILIRPGMFFGYGPLLQITSSNNHVRRLVIGGARNDPGGWGMIGHGIRLWGSNAHDNWIEGCYIGVDATGSGLLANDNDGVHLHQAGNNIIGTNGDGSNDDVEGNVIGGNGTRGICIDGTDQTNVIAGNRIGIGTDGTPLPNGEGVVIVEAFNCQIGSDNDSVSDDLEANIIACNTWRAVFVFLDGHPSSNLLSRNSIYGHARLGIEFEPYGVNENDGVKNTSHVNDGMDFPVFTAASLSGTTLHVKGYIGTNPSGTTTFANSRVEVYLSSYDGSTSPNPSESGDTAPYHGEGKVYLGALTASGQSLFEGDLNVTGKGLLLGDYVTGTATDTAGNTSEFSENREIAPPIDITASKISDPPGGGAQTVSPGDPITYTVEITNNGTSAQANLGTNEFEDTLPADTVYVSGTGEAVLDSTGNPWGTLDIVDDDVTWNGTIPAGDTVEITFAVEVLPTTQTSLCNSDAAVHWDGGTIPLDSGCVPFTAGPYISATKVSDPVGDGSQHVRPGEEITYTVTISNSGTIDQANLVTNEFVDTLPWHTSYVAGTGTAVLDSTGNPWGTLDIVDDDVTWNGTIPADDTVEISFTVAVLPAPAVTLCNPDAEVHWDKGTLTLDSGCIPLTPVPSLRVSKVAADENGVPLDRDDLVTYTITIWNEGYGSQSDNPGHEFEDPIPAHATYEPGTATAKRNDLPWGTIAYTSGRIVWDGAIGIGDFIRIEFKVHIDADTPYGTPICNDQAVVHWDANKDGTNETNLAIEAVCLTVTAEGAPLIEADKVGADDNGPPLIVGDTITYTITLVNSGPGVQPNDPASNELVDPIPEGTTYVANSLSATSGTATYDAVAKQVLWNGEIAPAETIEISFKVTVDECTGECEAISNAADVHWDADGDGTNDTVIVTSPPDFPPPAKAPGRVQIRAAITATDLDGPPLRTRDTLVYRITISNEGTEAQPDDPRGPEFVQAIPEGTTYVSNSARAIRSTSSSATSQSLNAKPAAVSILGIWYDPATATIYWNGSIPAGETIVIEYQVIVAAFVACGAEISCCGSVWWDSDSDGTNDSECPLTVTLTVEEGALGPGGVMARPNPVGSGGVVFTFDLPNDTHTAWFKLFDIDGTLLFSQEILPDVGIFPIVGTWNPQDSLGRPLGNGLYLYTVIIRHTNGTMSQSRVYKLVVAR